MNYIAKNQLEIYSKKMSSLVIFRGILKDKIMINFSDFLKYPTIESYSILANEVFSRGFNLTKSILKIILEDENCFLHIFAKGKNPSENLVRTAISELDFLQEISTLSLENFREILSEDKEFVIAELEISDINFHEIYMERMKNIKKIGYGIFAKYTAFTIKSGEIVPIKKADEISFEKYYGYEMQTEKIIANTKSFLEGKPAANALLYGDAGTGKSTNVKAVVNKFADEGLRIVELTKSDLSYLPTLIEKVAENPLKFIVFVDDISFSSADENFGSLKAILEGSVSTKAENVIIYATSNRRNLVRELFSDRAGDEIHASDTREETASLSERFGLKIAFFKPNRLEYFEIIKKIAAEKGLDCNEELLQKAEAFAMRRNGRSGRAAKHFVDAVLSGLIS